MTMADGATAARTNSAHVGVRLTLLPRHGKVEPFFRRDQVVVAVVADIELHPLDLTGESVTCRAVVR